MMGLRIFGKVHSVDSLVVDVNNAHVKSVTFRIGSQLNPQSAQTSPPNLASRVSPTDFKISNGPLRFLAGSRLAESKAHNRQTSIVHGYQHSRNGSIASTSSSPLSPQIIAAAGGDRIDLFNMENPVATIATTNTNNGAPLSSSSPNMTVASDQKSFATEDGTQNHTSKRTGKQHNGKSSKDYRYLLSHSKSLKEESKAVNEIALQVLFASFITLAEEKINLCITAPSDPEPQVEKICGPKVDLAFDHLISSLGHVASQKPKSLIDSLMLWRKSKSDAASEARVQLQLYRQQSRKNIESPSVPVDDTNSAGNLPLFTARQDIVVQAERRSIVSIYILCRVLIEVISQSTLAQITPETEEKLEGIIFGQLKITDADQLSKSAIRLANWTLFSKLLGVMAEINFKSVTERFISDLEKSQRELIVESTSNLEVERKMELILGGLKYVRIKVQPEDAWDQSCDFMMSIGRLFSQLHGHRLKYACCRALEALLLPIAAQADSELKKPKWSEVLGTIGPPLATMLIKPRHWSIAFPMTATLLCVSPINSFTTQWLQLILPLQPKLKDRYSRSICLQVISRLLWTYLYRAPSDAMNVTNKKLEEVLKLILPSGRKKHMTTDSSIADPLIQIIRIIGYKHPEFCLRTVIFPLIYADLFTTGRDLKVEQLEPEKIIIGINAFVAIISDLEKGENGRPPFPQDYQQDSHKDQSPDKPSATLIVTSPHSPTKEQSELSQPILTNTLSDVVLEYYVKFCEILGKITMFCDNAFGSQTFLDEKLNFPNPKTPLSDSFGSSRREDALASLDSKQAFYELFNLIVQVLPRFRSIDLPINTLVSLLCTGTAHFQDNIAESSANSLKSIAQQSNAQQIIMSYSRFVFSFDEKYCPISEGSVLEPMQIENTLQLYHSLLQIWIEETKIKLAEAKNYASEEGNKERREIPFDYSGACAYIDDIEAHMLFFLCSQSGKVRALSVTMLRLVREFDSLLGKDGKRLIHILEDESQNLLNFNNGYLSVPERSRLKRSMPKGNSQAALIELCSSETSYDNTLWFKIFPNLIRICYDRYPSAISITRELIGNRILQMYKSIVALSEVTRGLQYGSFDRYESGNSRVSSRSSSTPPEILIEQWKLYLVFNCTTLSQKGIYQQSSSSQYQHVRRGSKSNYAQEKITSARILFRYIIPLLSVSSASIRDSVVVSLGSINVNIYKILIEELQGVVNKCNDDAKLRIHQRTVSNPWKNRRTDLLRTEVAHVHQLTAHFLKNPVVYEDEWILEKIVTYSKDLKMFLMDPEVQANWEFQKLRRYYCGVIEELFEGISHTNNPSHWMDFESRKSSFILMEDWCGFSPNETQIRQREDNIRQSVIDQQSYGEWSTVMAAIEIEKRNLRAAALSAMAALCSGPLSLTTESSANLQTDVKRILSWINTTLSTGNDRIHVIGRKALKSLITHNRDFPYLLEYSISRCYLAENSKVLESYFDVVAQVLFEDQGFSLPFWRLLAICLFTLLSDLSDLRLKAADLLQILEERQERIPIVKSYKKNISDKTKAVYKHAQIEISKRLSKQNSDIIFYIHSEFTAYFKDLPEISRRNILTVIIPWTELVKLQVDSKSELTSQSFALLSNLCEITFRSGDTLQTEIQALWQALISRFQESNLQLILKFFTSICLDRREQYSVEFAKQIIVYLSNESLGEKIIEFLITKITPKNMVPSERRGLKSPNTDTLKIPYITDLTDIFPIGNRSAGFSVAQLSLIFLVDLVVSPIQIVADNLPLLLHVITSLWDHYIPIVQDQSREILVHLIHEFVTPKVNNENITQERKTIDDFIESIRRHDLNLFWSYEDNIGDNTGDSDESNHRIPMGMRQLVSTLNENFRVNFPEIQEKWTKLSLIWATSFPVNHLACRSFQIFRCIFTSLDQSMLAYMLSRLSNTISNDDPDFQAFSMEILITLRTFISRSESKELLKFPQLFWIMCACLDSVNEREFQEVILMLELFLRRVDLSNSNIRSLINEGRPLKWEGHFEGLLPLIYKGLRSSQSLEASLKIINKLINLPNDDLIGNDNKILFAILSNLPKFLHAMEDNLIDADNAQNANLISEIAQSQGHKNLSKVLNNYSISKYRTIKDFVAPLILAIKETFLPKCDAKILIFLMGLLTNSLSWFKLNALQILSAFVAEIDMCKPELASQIPDLISPLLHLLQTEYRSQAFEVLEKITILTSISIDKQQLRMSMVDSSSKAVRKEFERTPSLFGIPEESGWSIPNPARCSEKTRVKIGSVLYSLQNTGNLNSEVQLTQRFELHNDSFPHKFFETPERIDTELSYDECEDGDIGDLISKLENLDEFFESCLQSPATDSVLPRKTSEAILSQVNESGTQINEEQALPILYKSFSNPLSMSTFQNGFSDMKLPKPNTMNPGAFHNASSKRPGLHLRSATSPSAPVSFKSHTTMDMLDDEYNGVFSDADDERNDSHIESSFFLENIIKPLPQGIRSSVRRLTGGRSRDIDRLRESLRESMRIDRKGGLSQLKSPKVPKVPSTYLHKTLSPG